ncbi:glycosyltransferase family 2 protein [bacterium]|nr:glycosyltransferase family 2 protein [bacterium]
MADVSRRYGESVGPLISFVIPCYNRAGLIRRAVNSCLQLDGPEIEVIVVDDGSTDGTAAAVAKLRDRRVRLISHALNRGMSPARNTGIDKARGQWIFQLDSDDTLLPGALAVLLQHCRNAPADVSRLAAPMIEPDGAKTPRAELPTGRWGYLDYLWFYERTLGRPDFAYCIRRQALQHLRYPESRAWETCFYFDLAQHYLSLTLAEPLVRRRNDAPTQLGQSGPFRIRRFAGDQADSIYELLSRHQDALKEHAPRTYRRMLTLAANYSFLAGRRLRGSHYTWRNIRQRPLDPLLWGALIGGWLGPAAYAAGMALVWHWRGVHRN